MGEQGGRGVSLSSIMTGGRRRGGNCRKTWIVQNGDGANRRGSGRLRNNIHTKNNAASLAELERVTERKQRTQQDNLTTESR